MEISHNTLTILQLITTFFAAFAASSGFWLFLERKTNKKDLGRRLLVGLAHDRIIYLCMKYIQRGWISQDEYENLYQFLISPYLEMGENGSVKRLMKEVDNLTLIPNKNLENKIKESDKNVT